MVLYIFLTILDDCSRCIWIFLLAEKKKKKVAPNLKEFFAMAHTQFNKTVKIVYTNNSKEFTCLKPYFLKTEILYQTSMVHTPH